jgi:hypothetical protein
MEAENKPLRAENEQHKRHASWDISVAELPTSFTNNAQWFGKGSKLTMGVNLSKLFQSPRPTVS